MASQRHVRLIAREAATLLDGVAARGAAATDVLARDVLAAVRRAGDLEQARVVLRDPLTVVDPQALGAMVSALLAATVTGDLLGRDQVARQARAARVAIAPVDDAFSGQGLHAGFATGDLGTFGVEPLPPEDAIRLFRDKVPLTRRAFDRIIEAYRGRAFTVARQETVKAVSVIQGWLDHVLGEGLTFRDFRDGLQEAADAGGITAVNPYHARTVFETNVQTAYNAGRWEMYQAPEVAEAFPYFQYHTVGDDRVRPAHAQMEGYIARRDDPVWNLWWPPNGFNCRCTVTAISRDETEASGIRPSRRQVFRPDEGFAGNAAQAIRDAGLRDQSA